jgi:tyrosyl-tRNA synthetase
LAQTFDKFAAFAVYVDERGATMRLDKLISDTVALSRREATSVIKKGGVTVNGEKVGDIKQTFTMEQFAGEGLVVKRGKKSFRRVVVE